MLAKYFMNKHKKDKRIAHDLLYIANIMDAGDSVNKERVLFDIIKWQVNLSWDKLIRENGGYRYV